MDSPQKPGACVAFYPINKATALDFTQHIVPGNDAVNRIRITIYISAKYLDLSVFIIIMAVGKKMPDIPASPSPVNKSRLAFRF